jgi:hypothetical protein
MTEELPEYLDVGTSRERLLSTCGMVVAKLERGREKNREKYE